MHLSVISRNGIFRESVVRACREHEVAIECQLEAIDLEKIEGLGDILLWHFTADDCHAKNDLRCLAERHPTLKIVAVASQSLCPMLENECGSLLTAVLPETATTEALMSVLFLAAQGYNIKRAAQPDTAVRLDRRDDTPRENQDAVHLLTTTLPGNLSQREVEVLACLCAGQSNKSIARTLGVCDATVKAHLRSSFRRIGATNRTQAAIWANKHLSL
jgi:DNA-binding NarL/FixJ family response regulator